MTTLASCHHGDPISIITLLFLLSFESLSVKLTMNYDLSGAASSRESTLLNSNGRTIQTPILEAKTASTGMLYTA